MFWHRNANKLDIHRGGSKYRDCQEYDLERYRLNCIGYPDLAEYVCSHVWDLGWIFKQTTHHNRTLVGFRFRLLQDMGGA